jgi:ComF family protein
MKDCATAPKLLRAFTRSATQAFFSVADPVVAVLLAPDCAACHALLERPSRGAVCEVCWRSILPLTPPLCDGCGDPLRTWRTDDPPLPRCPDCRRGDRAVDRGRAIGAYEGALRDVVHAFKYEGRRSLAGPLANLMRVRGAEMLIGADAVVPVPLHRSRRRQRGFNQAADLARHLGLPAVALLRRSRATATQTDLPAASRRANVHGAFALARAFERTGARARYERSIVVLVDDVSTTGATLDACARVLKDAGVREVRALTAARVVTSRR